MKDSRRPACIECVMTWLLYGDGAVCLRCDRPIYRNEGEAMNLPPGLSTRERPPGERVICEPDEEGWQSSYVVTPDPPHNPLRSDFQWLLVGSDEQIGPTFVSYHEALMWRDGYQAAMSPREAEIWTHFVDG